MRKILLLSFFWFGIVGVNFCQVKWSQYQGPFSGDVISFTSIGDTLYAGTGIGVCKSENNGFTWSVTSEVIGSCGGLFAVDTVLFAARDASPVVSYNGGRTWRVYPYLSGLILDYKLFNDTVYAVTNNGVYVFQKGLDLWVKRTFGFGTDTDTWSKVPTEMCALGDTLFCGSHKGLYALHKGDTTWFEIPTTISGLDVDYGVQHLISHNGNLFAASFANKQVFQSVDSGSHWVNVGMFFENSVQFNKLVAYNDTVFLATSIGVFKYDLEEKHWLKVCNEVFKSLYVKDTVLFASNDISLYRWNQTLNQFIVSNRGINTAKVYDLALFDKKLFTATYSGTYFTPDDGVNWYCAHNTSGLICQSLEKLDTMLFLGTSKGLFVMYPDSLDFTPIGRDAFSSNVWDVNVRGGLVYAGTDDGLFVSKDSGGVWTRIDAGFGQVLKVASNDSLVLVGTCNGLYKVSEIDNKINLIGFKDVGVSSINIIDGVVFVCDSYNRFNYKSIDTCKTWKQLSLDSYAPIYDMFKRGCNIYASGTMHIYYSSNMGDTWDTWSEQGMPNLYIYRVIEGDSVFYAGTFGRSIWKRTYLAETSLSSNSFIVNESVISKIPSNTTSESLANALDLSYGASGSILSKRSSEEVKTGDVFRVTAENSKNYHDYQLRLLQTNAVLTSNIFEVDQATKVILVPSNTNISYFKDNINLSEGATVGFFKTDGVTIADDLNSGCKAVVVAEDGVTKAVYSINLITSVGDNIESLITVYPVPVNDRLYIKGISVMGSCIVYDLIGQKVNEYTFESNSIDVNDLSAGVYVLGFMSKSHMVYLKFTK